MGINKIYPVLLFILLSLVFAGCIGEPKGYVGYTIFITPSEGSETTLIIPVIMDVNTGEFDHVVLKDGKVVSIFEVKIPEDQASKALNQMDTGIKNINNGYIETIGYNLKPEQFTGNIEKITVGPKNGVGYHMTLDFSGDELRELYDTVIKGGI